MNLDKAIRVIAEEINISGIKGTTASGGKSKSEIVKWVFYNKYRNASKDPMSDTFQKFISKHNISIKNDNLNRFIKNKTVYIVKVDDKEYKIKNINGELNELR